MSVAERYASLKLPVGVLVIDYKNQRKMVMLSRFACCSSR